MNKFKINDDNNGPWFFVPREVQSHYYYKRIPSLDLDIEMFGERWQVQCAQELLPASTVIVELSDRRENCKPFLCIML